MGGWVHGRVGAWRQVYRDPDLLCALLSWATASRIRLSTCEPWLEKNLLNLLAQVAAAAD